MTRRIPRYLAALSIAILLTALVWSPLLAASPSPSAGPPGGDPRSSGEGAGLVGDPAFAIAAALGLGLASALATYLYVRLTAGRSRP